MDAVIIGTVNDDIMEDIERITEKTAQELADAFDEFAKSTEEFILAFEDSMSAYMKECQRAAAAKFVEYMYRYTCATFLTRWYWLRKARKCNDTLKEIIELNENKKYDRATAKES